MTTLSAYLDTLTTQAAAHRHMGQNRLVGRTTQRFLLVVGDMLMIGAALVLGVFARGLVPLDGGTPAFLSSPPSRSEPCGCSC